MKNSFRWSVFLLLVLFGLLPFFLLACQGGDALADDTHNTAGEETVMIPPQTQNELLLHLGFDEGSGNTVTDLSGSQDDGTVEYVYTYATYQEAGEDPLWRTGIKGTSLLFDGFSMKIRYPDIMLEPSAFTISAWIAPRAFNYADGTLNAIIAQYMDEEKDTGFAFGYGDYGQLTARIAFENADGESKWITISEKGYLPVFAWSYVAITYDQTSGILTLYRNGEPVRDREVGSEWKMRLSERQLVIGCNPSAGYYETVYPLGIINGLLDEVKIYRKTLSADEINAEYTSHLTDGVIPSIERSEIWTDPTVLSDDIYHPQYHLMPNQFATGETIAPFYYNGVYHIFTQSQVCGTYWRNPIWGHYISTDLVNWTEVTPALWPDGSSIDKDYTFAGNAMVDANGKPYLFYTAVNLSKANLNCTTFATPADPTDPKLLDWEKSHVIIPQVEGTDLTAFRDPYLYQENGHVYMLLGTTTKYPGGTPEIVCYKASSNNLEEWDYLGITLQGDRSQYPNLMDTWELPVLLKLTDESGTVTKYFLSVFPMHNSGNVTYYWLGNFDLETGVFTPDKKEPTVFGTTDSASTMCGFTDPVSGKALVWQTLDIAPGMSAMDHYNAGWTIGTSLPRALSLNADGTLRIEAFEGYETLHKETVISRKNITVEELNEAVQSLNSDMLHLKLTVDMKDAYQFILRLYEDKTGRTNNKTILSYSTVTGELTLNGSQSGLWRNPSYGTLLNIKEDGILTLDVYMDRCALEVFSNGTVLAAGIYRDADASCGISLDSRGGEVAILSAEIYEMNAIASRTTAHS